MGYAIVDGGRDDGGWGWVEVDKYDRGRLLGVARRPGDHSSWRETFSNFLKLNSPAHLGGKRFSS